MGKCDTCSSYVLSDNNWYSILQWSPKDKLTEQLTQPRPCSVIEKISFRCTTQTSKRMVEHQSHNCDQPHKRQQRRELCLYFYCCMLDFSFTVQWAKPFKFAILLHIIILQSRPAGMFEQVLLWGCQATGQRYSSSCLMRLRLPSASIF